MRKQSTFWLWPILSGIFLVDLLLYVDLGRFSRLLADDYCSAYMVQRLGLLRSIWYWYLNWSGGFSTSVADGLLEIFGRYGQPATIPIFLLLWVTGTVWAVFMLLPGKLPKNIHLGLAMALGLGMMVFVLLFSPNVPQSLFWWGGMRAYSMPLALFTLYTAFYQFFRARVWPEIAQALLIFVSLATTLFMAGFSETFTPVMVVFLAGWLVLGVWTKSLAPGSPSFYFVLAGFAGGLLGLFIMVAAPGNTVRQAAFHQSINLQEILNISFSAYLAFLRWLIGSAERMAGLLALVLLGVWAGFHIESASLPRGWWIPAAFFNGLLFMFGCFPPAAYGMSDAAPDRALIIAAYFGVGNFLLGGCWLGMWLRHKVPSFPRLMPILTVALAVSVIVTVSLNFQRLAASRPLYVAYAQHWDKVDAQILSAKAAGQAEVHIPAISNWAGVLEPNDNPRFWVTLCMSKYYDIAIFGSNPDLP